MRLIVNKYRFEMIDARKRKRYRTRQFHIRKSINKIYIYIKRNTKIRCNDRAKERVESKNDPLILANEFTVAAISQSSGETFRPCITRRRKMDSAPTRVYNHDYVSSVLPHRGSRDTNLPCDLSRLSSDRRLPARSVVVFCAYA